MMIEGRRSLVYGDYGDPFIVVMYITPYGVAWLIADIAIIRCKGI
jgi:hypothetical protein